VVKVLTVTSSGSNKTEACKGWVPEMHDKIDFTREFGRGDCETILRRYTFGLKYNRFLSTFEAGDYVLGRDREGDTPSISGGTCTKIQ
jgi:hypothetical protein